MKIMYAILKREFRLKIKSKSFYLFILITPLLFILPVIMNIASNSKQETDKYIVFLVNSGNDIAVDSIPFRELTFVFSDSQQKIEEYFKEPTTLGVVDLHQLSLTQNDYSKKIIKYFTVEASRAYKINDIESFLHLTYYYSIRNTSELNLEIKDYEVYPVLVNSFEQKQAFLSSAIAFTLGLLIYIILILFNNSILKSVAEEKNNNLSDVLAIFIKPRKIMLGKIFGLTLLSLIQFVLWIVVFICYLLILHYVVKHFESDRNTQALSLISDLKAFLKQMPNAGFLWIILVFFAFGFMLNGIISTILGVLTIRKGANHFMFLGNILSLSSMYFAMFAAVNPTSTMIQYAKFIPFFNYLIIPTLMPYEINPVEIIIALFILIITVVIALFLAIRIYESLIYDK